MGKHVYAKDRTERREPMHRADTRHLRGRTLGATFLSLALWAGGFLSPVTAFAFDWNTTYPRVVDFLDESSQQLRAGCQQGDAQACQGLQTLNGLVDTLNTLGAQCHDGDSTACQVLAVEIWGTDTLRKCAAGEQQSCATFEQARQLKTACGQGDSQACEALLRMPDTGSAQQRPD